MKVYILNPKMTISGPWSLQDLLGKILETWELGKIQTRKTNHWKHHLDDNGK